MKYPKQVTTDELRQMLADYSDRPCLLCGGPPAYVALYVRCRLEPGETEGEGMGFPYSLCRECMDQPREEMMAKVEKMSMKVLPGEG